MSTTTATTPSWKSPSHSHSNSRSSRPSTTPRAYSNAVSVGQNHPPKLSPKTLSTPSTKKTHVRSPSPSYFGFVAGDDSIPPDSNPGFHTRQNWKSPTPQPRNNAPQPSRQLSMEHDPEFAAFRRQSEQNKFDLSNSLSKLSKSPSPNNSTSGSEGVSPASQQNYFDKPKSAHEARADHRRDQQSFFDLPRASSPATLSPRYNVDDHLHARLSLPAGTLQTPPLDKTRQPARSDTLPGHQEKTSPSMITPQQFADFVGALPHEILLLDLRVYPQYSIARLRNALNLCIPTTLLKRPSFTVQKLADTFTHDHDRRRFSRWRECSHICVYDANSHLPKEAILPFTVLKKFASEGWHGQGLVIKGGYLALSKTIPHMIDNGPVDVSGDSRQSLSISPPVQDVLAIAGGCSIPSTKSAANPFFGSIRQNMDLLDGVGQMPVRFPRGMNEDYEHEFPAWLRKAARRSNEGKMVSDAFLGLEKMEQKRLQQAYSGNVSYGTPRHERPSSSIEMAGIERGSKNRYKDILPFDHSRVKIHDFSPGDCDYINASHVQSSLSNRKYIATQAPLPATFSDFWRVVWEQEARAIVMLTAEKDGGQAKAHAYWHTGEYGPFKLKLLSERTISLDRKESKSSSSKGPEIRRPDLGQRRSTNPNTPTERKILEADVSSPRTSEPSIVTVRHFTLSHSSYPFKPLRELHQFHYSQWPDLGAPTEPSSLVELIELVNKCVRQSSAHPTSSDDPAPEGQRPIVVHCSAGCGRTGTFCTIDSVIDMLKRQKAERAGHHGKPPSHRHQSSSSSSSTSSSRPRPERHQSHSHSQSSYSSSQRHDRIREEDGDGMDIDDAPRHGSWLARDDEDLIARTVDEFRRQRLSMVQNLRQFVLCYESVITWLFRGWERDGLTGGPRSGGGSYPSEGGSGKDKRPGMGERDHRKSYHG